MALASVWGPRQLSALAPRFAPLLQLSDLLEIVTAPPEIVTGLSEIETALLEIETSLPEIKTLFLNYRTNIKMKDWYLNYELSTYLLG